MFCRFCGSLNAHYEYVYREVDCGQHQLTEEDVEVVFCPDCIRVQLTDPDTDERLKAWLEELGDLDPSPTCRYHMPDGSVIAEEDDEDAFSGE